KPGLGGPRLGAPVVAETDLRRERHEDRFRPPARLQAEEGATVVEEVELDVAAAPVELEVALALAIRDVLPALDDRQVGAEQAVAHGALEGERALEPPLGEVVEEEPP